MTVMGPFSPPIVDGDCDEPPTLSLAWLFGRMVPYKAALLPVSDGNRQDWVQHLISCPYKTECLRCPFRRP